MSGIKTESIDGALVITLPPIMESMTPEQLESTMKGWLLDAAKVHVLDFAAVVSFKQSMYRPFVVYNQALKGGGKSLFSIHLPAKLIPQFQSDGLTSVFVSVASVDEARKRAGGDKGAIDVDFINPFLSATKMVLETQAQTPITLGKPYVKKPDERIPMEIAGVISLACAEFRGSITLCFRAATFLKIYENMVGEKHDKIIPEMEDAAGELLNIIFGQAKTVLNDQKGYSLEKALPTILVGENLQLRHQSRNPALVLPFESAAGGFHIEIVVDRS